jgi:outer membrane lipoprotein-sorting protein
MKRINIGILVLLTCIAVFPLHLSAQNAEEILHKMDAQAATIKDKTADVVMEMINNRTGKIKTRKAILKQKMPDKTLFRFTYPPSQAGIGTLSLPGGIVYLYLPAFGKPKKISNLANSGAFSQSDFSTEDMGPRDWVKNYTAAILSTNDTAYILKLIPKVQSDKYSKLVVTVNKKHFFPQSVAYYNLQGNLTKEADYQYEKIGHLWSARIASMTNFRKAHTTRVINSNVKLNQGLKTGDFTVGQLVPPEKRKEK